MFIAASLLIDKTWKPPKYPSSDKQDVAYEKEGSSDTCYR